MREIQQAVAAWRRRWSGASPPELRVGEHAGILVLVDTRGLEGTEPVALLEPEAARRLLTPERFDASAAQLELIERKLAVSLDGWLQPLAVADPAVLALLAAEMDGEPLSVATT